MKIFRAVGAAILACGLATGLCAEDATLKGLFAREQAVLSKLPERHLQSMLEASGPAQRKVPKTVNFSHAWLDAQPVAKGNAEWRCLSEALYFEARGETVRGQFAVAEVILNRVKSSRFPNTLCGVIHQGTGKRYQCQFTYTCDGHKEVIAEPLAFKRVGKVAQAAMEGLVPALTGGATHYHTTAVRPKWASVYRRTARIGVHLFYRHNWRTASN